MAAHLQTPRFVISIATCMKAPRMYIDISTKARSSEFCSYFVPTASLRSSFRDLARIPAAILASNIHIHFLYQSCLLGKPSNPVSLRISLDLNDVTAKKMPTYVVTGKRTLNTNPTHILKYSSNPPGANRGLGLEFVRQLSLDESNTILACVRTSSADLGDLKKVASPTTKILTCDTGSLDSIRSFVSEASETLKGTKIDFLLNNAGINSVPEQTSLSINPADLDENIRVNVIGPAKTTQFLLEAELLSPSARIVNMSSGLGSMAVSLSISPRKCATYSISKAALNALTVQQSGEVRERLGKAVVICMDPGWVKTRMGGKGAEIEAEVSIGGMLKCVHGLTDKSNGKFFTYTGEEVKW
jgi:NAD(P)-dependent dehydrogenase (short-subunit alcohol dehydrogenase family)